MSRKPRVILGLMTFGPDEKAGARVTSMDEFNKALDLFQERAYTEVDTARGYVGGKQEAWSRDANWKGRGLSIATKVYPIPAGKHKAEIITEHFETSLKELGTDSVDIAYLHAPDRSVPFAETLEAMDKLHKAGKFKELGLSNFTAFEVAECVMTCKYNGWVRPTIYQGVYNCIQRGIEAELVPACHRYGLDVVVYSPIAGGLFSGAYKKDEVPSKGRYSNTFMGGALRGRYFKDNTFAAIDQLKEVADKHGVGMIEVALRWLIHHSNLNIKDGGNDGIIIGASSLAHLKSNLDDMEKGPLPEDLLEALDRMWAMVKAESGNYWHLDLAYTYDTKEVLFGPGAK